MGLFTKQAEKPSYFDRIGYQAGLLAGICCIVSLLIFGGNASSKALIEEVLRQDQLNMLNQVLPVQLYNNSLLEDALTIPELKQLFGSDTLFVAKYNGEIVGYAFLVVEEGYSGKINILLAVDKIGNIIGARVISHTETPGLGDKIEITKSDWITAFNGKSLTHNNRKQWAVKKDGGEFDQFTGATITPRAVVKAIVNGLRFYAKYSKTLATAKTATQTTTQTTHPSSLSDHGVAHE